MFDPNNEHSNISAIFPGLESNIIPKRLFQKDVANENSQFGPKLTPKKQADPVEDIEVRKENLEVQMTPELVGHQFLQQSAKQNEEVMKEPECKLNEDIALTWTFNQNDE